MTDGGSGLYRTISGTSMATPHVSGAAAILAQQHPGWTGQQLKEQLMSSAQGPGRLVLAVRGRHRSPRRGGRGDATPCGAPARVLLGNYAWPHEPSDGAVTKDLTFTNDGDQDVTLDLALTGTSGTAFALGASTVTVPAGGKATVPVTGDPQAVGLRPPRRLRRRHRRRRPATPVTRTSLGLIKEDERYDLDDQARRPRRSARPPAWVGVNLAGDPWPWAEYVDGETTLRMPPGTYSVTAYLDVQRRGARPVRPGRAGRPGDRARPAPPRWCSTRATPAC